MARPVHRLLAVIGSFVVVAAAMMTLMPGPLREFDFFVIGCVATLAALLTLFVAMISTAKSTNVFFKKRKK